MLLATQQDLKKVLIAGTRKFVHTPQNATESVTKSFNPLLNQAMQLLVKSNLARMFREGIGVSGKSG